MNVVPRDRAAEDFVYELKVAAAWPRVHLDFAVAVLAMAASLLLVAALHISVATNGLAIWHLRRFQIYFRVVTLLQLGDGDLDVLLARAGDEEFLGLLVAKEAQHRIFFHEFVNAVGELVFIGTRLGLDR